MRFDVIDRFSHEDVGADDPGFKHTSGSSVVGKFGRHLNLIRDGLAKLAWLVLSIFRRPFWRGAASGLTWALLIWMISDLRVVRGLENWAIDGCFWVRGARRSPAKVVIVGLDDASLSALNKPLTSFSAELAKVIAYLDDRRAAAIGVDILIPDHLDQIPEITADAPQVGSQTLASNKVVLPTLQLDTQLIKPLSRWIVPYPELNDLPTAPPLGFINLTEDGDSILRRQQLLIHVGDQNLPHFALALVGKFSATGGREAEVRSCLNGQGIYLGDRFVPLDDQGRLRINYVGPPGTIRVIPFRDVLQAAAGVKAISYELEGAVVIIGVTSRLYQDEHATPFSNNFVKSAGVWE